MKTCTCCEEEAARYTIFKTGGVVERLCKICFPLISGSSARDIFSGRLDIHL